MIMQLVFFMKKIQILSDIISTFGKTDLFTQKEVRERLENIFEISYNIYVSDIRVVQ